MAEKNALFVKRKSKANLKHDAPSEREELI